MTKERISIPDSRKIRNLKQYKDLTDDEFDEMYSQMKMGIEVSNDLNERIARKLEECGEDYDLDDLKFNDSEDPRKGGLECREAVHDFGEADEEDCDRITLEMRGDLVDEALVPVGEVRFSRDGVEIIEDYEEAFDIVVKGKNDLVHGLRELAEKLVKIAVGRCKSY